MADREEQSPSPTMGYMRRQSAEGETDEVPPAGGVMDDTLLGGAEPHPDKVTQK